MAIQPTHHVLGDPKAPVTLIEYASFTCPHCAHFDTQILPEVKKKWIDSGKVKLIYRDFPLDQTAVKAAQLAECSGKDRYYAVVDMICFTPESARQLTDALRAARPLLLHCGTIWVHGPARLVPVTEDEPRTAYEVSLALFPDPLSSGQRRFALVETRAHLEHLVLRRRARRVSDATLMRYAASG